MKKAFLSLGLATMCSAHLAAETHKIYETVCKGKAQNAAVSYTQQGVIFNGTCQPDSNSKLIFQPPQPLSTSDVLTESTLAVTASVNENPEVDLPILEDEQHSTEINVITDIDSPTLEDEHDNTETGTIENIDQPVINE